MDSLLNRLKPEYLEVLSGLHDFPSTKEKIIKVLGSNEWPGDVKLGDCITIASFLADDKIDLYNFREMFYKYGDKPKADEYITPSVIIYNGEL